MSFGKFGDLLPSLGKKTETPAAPQSVEAGPHGEPVRRVYRRMKLRVQDVLAEDETDPTDYYRPGARESRMDRTGRGPNGAYGDERVHRRFLRDLKQSGEKRAPDGLDSVSGK